MPRIAVIVPVYKVESFLDQCINSILKQTFDDFLLVLVDDGSPDSCGSKCDNYSKIDSRIVCIHKENGGLSSARNAGIDYAIKNTEIRYISFIDSDDYVLPTFLESLYKSIETTNSDMSLCNFYRVKQNEIISKSEIDYRFNPNDCFFGKTVSVVAWNKLYKKELFNDIRYPIGKLHEDEHIIHRLVALCNKISFVEDALYCYRQNENSIISTETEKQKILCSIDYLTDRLCFYYFEKNDSKQIDKYYDILLKKLIDNYHVLDKTVEYKKSFLLLKRIYKSRKKSKNESLFFSFPLLHKLARKIGLIKKKD